MKNIKKFGWVIAILAVISVMVGCQTEAEADPDDQIGVTVTGLPSGAENFFTLMVLSKDGSKDVARASALKGIVNGRSTNKMVFSSGKNEGLAYGETGNYYVMLGIFDKTGADANSLYTGKTTEKFTINKGQVKEIDISDFSPLISTVTWPTTPLPPPPPAEKPGPTFFGTYSGEGYKANLTETIVFSESSFRISDNESTPEDYLEFEITKWEAAVVPQANYFDYLDGYKFTGKIKKGKPVTTGTDSFIYGKATAPGFNQSDIDNGTECHMYIYTNGSGANFKFARTTFYKNSDPKSNPSAFVKTVAGERREYQKKP